jgi:regulatory protein
VALGIEPTVAARAVATPAGHDELAAAVALLRARIRRPPQTDRDRERALGLLARRGYELELAYDAVRAFEREG